VVFKLLLELEVDWQLSGLFLVITTVHRCLVRPKITAACCVTVTSRVELVCKRLIPRLPII
jgi:hypothetical protein